MVTISLPENRVVLIGYSNQRIRRILLDQSVTKLVIFDDNEGSRFKFERIYPRYKDRITLYEGDIKANLSAYFQLRQEDGVTLEMHRAEILNDYRYILE